MRIERELSTNLGEKVILYVEHPKSTGREYEFSCKIGLEGAEINKSTTLYGIDPIQALVLSIRHLDGFVSRASKSIHPRHLEWELGKGDDKFGLRVDIEDR